MSFSPDMSPISIETVGIQGLQVLGTSDKYTTWFHIDQIESGHFMWGHYWLFIWLLPLCFFWICYDFCLLMSWQIMSALTLFAMAWCRVLKWNITCLYFSVLSSTSAFWLGPWKELLLSYIPLDVARVLKEGLEMSLFPPLCPLPTGVLKGTHFIPFVIFSTVMWMRVLKGAQFASFSDYFNCSWTGIVKWVLKGTHFGPFMRVMTSVGLGSWKVIERSHLWVFCLCQAQICFCSHFMIFHLCVWLEINY